MIFVHDKWKTKVIIKCVKIKFVFVNNDVLN